MGLVRTFLAGTVTITALSAFLAGSMAVVWIGELRDGLPDPMQLSEWVPAVGTTIRASDGSVIGRHASENRRFVPLSEIPHHVVDAFIAAEDKDYWTHAGIDPLAIARATLSNVKEPGRRPEGGSTITQQVVKNLLVGPERSLERKVREALVALQADREIGKEKILEIYLNEIYFGAGAYGVAAAAETYFGVDLSALGVAEAALLAGLPKAPSAANPFTSPSRAAARRAYVLGRMLEDGYITHGTAATAMEHPLPAARPAPASFEHAFWYAQEAARRFLVDEAGSGTVYGSGGEAITTFVPAVQRAAHASVRAGAVAVDRMAGWRGPIARGVPLPVDWEAVRRHVPPGSEDWRPAVVLESSRDAVVLTVDGEVTLRGADMKWASPSGRASAVLSPGDAVLVADLGHGLELVQIPEVQAAAAVLDPRTGHVLALAGGFSGETSEFDRSTQASRQVGSAFKPFVYLAALEEGFDAMSPVMDSPISLDQEGQADWRPRGGEAGGMGLITLRRSLELSRNLSTVRLLYDLGMDRVRDTVHRVGLTLPPDAGWSTALGVTESSPLALAGAYAALANGGHPVIPGFFSSRASVGQPTIDAVSVAQLTSILEGVMTHGTASSAFKGFDRPVAGKTGTTNAGRDVWFVAYGPAIVVSAWVGMDDMSPLPRGATGATAAAPIVRSILEKSGDAISFEPFTLPPGATTVRAWRSSGAVDPAGDVIEITRER